VLENGGQSPYRDWFHWHPEALDGRRPVRPYPWATDVDEAPDEPSLQPTDDPHGDESVRRLGYRAWWGLPALPKLNTANPHAREYLLSAAEHWIRFGADGWRLDVAEEVPDDFWREFRQRVKAVDPDAYIVAEIWHEKPSALGGDMYDALMNYPLAEAILSFVGAGRLDRRVIAQHFNLDASVRDEDAATFAGRLQRALTIYDPNVTAVQLNLLDSHDTPRFLTMASGDTRSLELGTLMQMTLPGAPSIYYGDEIGLQGEQDPFSRGSFPWDHPERWDRTLLTTFATTAALRHAHRVLRHGGTRVVAAVASTIAYLRSDGPDQALVVVNAGDQPCRLSIQLPELDGRMFVGTPWRAGDRGSAIPERVVVSDGRLELHLPPRDGALLIAG
jgi:cyclomaltodextrinase